MKALVYLTTEAEIDAWRSAGVDEVIIACSEFSRRGTLGWTEALALNEQAQAAGLKTTFEWDALMEGPRFRDLSAAILRLPTSFHAVRVRDAGAALWIRDKSAFDVQIILEAGHHNLLALKSWHQRLGARLTRVALSPELPLSVLKTWRSEFPVPFEILGLGPLLLFHSPRALLSTLESAPDKPEIWAEGASEESPHKGFLLSENTHGTLMFHPKDLGLLERWDDVALAGVDVLRLDHRREGADITAPLSAFIQTPSPEACRILREAWSREWMRGYLDVNKTDVLFDRLKNEHLISSENVCGVVLDHKREGWLAVRVRGFGLRVGTTVELVNPLGKKRMLLLAWLKDDAFQPVAELREGQVGFIPWSARAPAKTRLLKA